MGEGENCTKILFFFFCSDNKVIVRDVVVLWQAPKSGLTRKCYAVVFH